MARTVVLDLAGQAALARDLAAGGVLVPDALEIGEDVDLVLRGGGDMLRISATCVWLNGDKGSGLQLSGCDADMKQRIADMATASSDGLDGHTQQTTIDPTDQAHTDLTDQHADLTDQTHADLTDQTHADLADTDAPLTDTQAYLTDAHADLTDVTRAAPAEDETIEESDDATDGKKVALNVHERMRGLTLAQQIKAAQHGEVGERIVLERLYGKAVWEALLRNPRLTGPEVARIARMGALPRPLMEIILANGGWLQIPEVRRALLTNPRLGVDQIQKILRMLPKHELKLAAMQTAYPFGVRDVAKRMLKEQGGG